MSSSGQPALRRVGGPPRKIPSTPARNARSGSGLGTKGPSPARQSKAAVTSGEDSTTRKRVTLRANPSLISQMEFEEEEDDDWDEVALPSAHEPVARDFASSPALQAESRPMSRATTVTDDETATDRTATATEAEDEDDVEHANLMAAYGYDFNTEETSQAGPSTNSGDIEISLGARDGLTEEQRAAQEEQDNRKKPLTARDRALRLEAYKLHILCLLANASYRNRWCCDDLLKSRLLSLAPHALHAAFHIPPSRYPDAMQRARMFQTALQDLATWWANHFFEIPDTTIGVKTRSWDECMEIVEQLPRLVQNAGLKVIVDGEGDTENALRAGKLKAVESLDPKVVEEFQTALGPGGEQIRTVKSMMKKALQAKGGRDTSSQLFVALCRSLGLGARLVVSLQAVQWKADKQPTTKGSGKSKASKTDDAEAAVSTPKVDDGKRKARKAVRRKGKVPEKTVSEEEEEDEMEEVPITDPTSATTAPPQNPVPQRRVVPSKSNRIGHRLDQNEPIIISDTESNATDASSKRKQLNVGKGGAMNPLKKERADYYKLGKSKGQKLGHAPKAKKRKEEDLSHCPPVFWAEVYSRSEQKWIPVDPVRGVIKRKKDFEPSSESGPVRMLYVVAFEEDGYAREVTVRYARNFAAKTMKLRVPVKKDQEDWWARVMRILERPYRLHRDEIEDAELELSQVSEGMPMMMAGFKDHPLYVLERHLKREEVILPKREVGRFKGEPVYRRSNVVSCKTPENWMRIGRIVKPRQEPLKWVKQRAVTLDRRRAQELANIEGKDPIQQGLYAEWQTEIFTPPPIENGKIPKNAFGNLDLYVPTMLPPGAVHLPYKGIAKVAKQLGVDYAEACTGFEFKKQRAIPVLTGIAVAQESETLVLETYWKSAAAAEERALNKKQQRALERWFKLINGIKIRKRVQAQYGDSGANGVQAPRIGIRAEPKKETPMASVHMAQDNDTAEKLGDEPLDVSQTEGDDSSAPIAKRPLSIKLNVNHKKTPSVAETQLAMIPSAHSSTSEHIGATTAERPNADNNDETEEHNDPTKASPPNDDNGLLQTSEPGTEGRRTSRRAAATAAKKKLKADSDAEDADDEYRPATKGVRASTRVTRSRAR